MASGRDEWTADRNRQIKMASEDGVPPRVIADLWGLSRQKVHKILSDPHSGDVTLVRATPRVRLLDPQDPHDGISHGTPSGYRKCVARPQGSCDDCKTANALKASAYAARKRTEHPRGVRSPRRG
jgi:hypothetical protein